MKEKTHFVPRFLKFISHTSRIADYRDINYVIDIKFIFGQEKKSVGDQFHTHESRPLVKQARVS